MNPKKDIISWEEVFAHRAEQDSARPIHARVISAGLGVPHVREGDELFIHEITSNEISLKRQAASISYDEFSVPTPNRRLSTPSEWNPMDEDLNELEIILPLEYKEKFTLCPTYKLDHVFNSVREILNTLPAISKLIYPLEDIILQDKIIRVMERLEIIDQIHDTQTGNEVLVIRSMKTETQHYLTSTLNVKFVQLPSDCFRFTSSGLTPQKFVRDWKPGRPPFVVKLCPLTQKPVEVISKPDQSSKDKKDKRKKLPPIKANIPTNVIDPLEDRKLIPSTWWDKKLLIKPFQKIRVKNIMFDAKEFFLAESTKLKVEIISATNQLPTENLYSDESYRRKSRGLSAAEIFTGPLSELPLELISDSGDPLQLMIAAGTASTGLRQQPNITEGSRIVVYRTIQSTKLVMSCSKLQQFLVDLSYKGLFKRFPVTMQQTEINVTSLLNAVLPCKVQITNKDAGLGYDQLAKREILTVNEIIPEITLMVDIISPTGQVVSEKPFELPLHRTGLTVQVLEQRSHKIHRPATLDLMKRLPAVEFLSDNDMRELKKSMRKYSSDAPMSPEFFFKSKRNSTSFQPNDSQFLIPSRFQPTKLPGNLDISDNPIPPPRPPKSPTMQGKLVDSVFNLPQLPPKPDRYKQEYFMQNYNRNNNNNNNASMNMDSKQLSVAESIQNKKMTLQRKRNTLRNNSVNTLDVLIEENKSFLNAIKHQPSLEAIDKELRRTIDKQSDGAEEPTQNSFSSRIHEELTTFPNVQPQRQPKAKGFQEMHEQFNPSVTEPLENTRTIQEPAQTIITDPLLLNTAQLGTYQRHANQCTSARNESNSRLPTIFTKGKQTNGGNMSNPNYGIRLGDEIFDPAFDGNKADVDQKVANEPIYVFASDVSSREELPSLTDDNDEYEVMNSPQLLTPTSEEVLYSRPWQYNPSLGKERKTVREEDDYEEEEYGSIKVDQT